MKTIKVLVTLEVNDDTEDYRAEEDVNGALDILMQGGDMVYCPEYAVEVVNDAQFDAIQDCVIERRSEINHNLEWETDPEDRQELIREYNLLASVFDLEVYED